MYYFLFDTNVLLKNPNLLNIYKEQSVVSFTVLQELDFLKKDRNHAENAQLAIKHINQHGLKIFKSANTFKAPNDEKILEDAQNVKQSDPQYANLIIISNDESMQIKSRTCNITAMNLSDFFQFINPSDDIATEERIEFFSRVEAEDFEKAMDIFSHVNINVNFYLENGHTPLIECIRKKKIKQVSFLVKLPGIDLNKLDQAKYKMPPFMHAAQKRSIPMMKILLENGVHHYISSRGQNRGNTALLIAVWDEAEDVIKFLINEKMLNISLNQADGNGYTPLIKAAIKGSRSITKLLLEHNVDIYIRDRNDKSALEHAQENGYTEIVEMIKKAGKI